MRRQAVRCELGYRHLQVHESIQQKAGGASLTPNEVICPKASKIQKHLTLRKVSGQEIFSGTYAAPTIIKGFLWMYARLQQVFFQYKRSLVPSSCTYIVSLSPHRGADVS